MSYIGVTDLFSKSIYWQQHPTSSKYFFALNDNNLLLLRLNNFPEEPLLTLIDKLEIVDLEEVPDNWVVPF